ncbi:NTP transferase domain-containing protein [Sphingomicrobium clamense]|uniref:Nucleotidyltransferase family protein n=1 Tax=Sphingomicrobium clamense TaxID=2851013 RepID=A0ABS6V3T9_9SPHN|nr:NTP transferase domain-containing protein [Sphingomicrobium sp. B8]MBW0144216.1 nucleotidyltransferase family protein [Sphingomicrobium sp. B8]
MSEEWTAILLAGARPGVDPFAQQHGTDLKPLIPVLGIPMVARVATSLLASSGIGEVRVLTQFPARIAEVLPEDPRIKLGASDGTIAETMQRILADPETQFPLLVTTADHALLDPAMVADFLAKAEGADVAVGLVERKNLLERLPQSKRTWLKFRGGAWSGANLFALGSPEAAKAVELWRSVEQDRKKGIKMIAALGPTLLVGSILRLRSLQGTLDKVGKKLGLNIRAVAMDNPLAAVDVDKEDDHILVTAILKGEQ